MNQPSPTTMTPLWPNTLAAAKCAMLGHKVDHTSITRDVHTPCARCGAAILDQDHAVSRVAHTLSCFLGWHHYLPMATRAGHHEYVCEKCGHPLLFEQNRDPYSGQNKFKKRVNYACGLFGHRVHVVETRPKTTEYACRCGHSFLREQRALNVIRHPLRCVMLGHFVRVNEIRGDWTEYICLRCGHPFCFKLAAGAQIESDLERPLDV